MANTFALAIPHCNWLSERVLTLKRLMSEIGPHDPFKLFTDREPNWSWAPKLWQWGLDTECTHLVQLQDDVITDSKFFERLHMMVESIPENSIIGLQTAHPLARHLYDSDHTWCTTDDGLIGVGYVLPRSIIEEMLKWRYSIDPNIINKITEDTSIDVFAYVHGYKIWHPLPTIIDHDVSVKSVYNNDNHPNRRPVASTILGDMPNGVGDNLWARNCEIRHLGLFYGVTVPSLAQQTNPGLMRVDEQISGIRKTLSEMIEKPGQIKTCVVCGVAPTDVTGMTGMGFCRFCMLSANKALLGIR